jgi:hypothetical protein
MTENGRGGKGGRGKEEGKEGGKKGTYPRDKSWIRHWPYNKICRLKNAV